MGAFRSEFEGKLKNPLHPFCFAKVVNGDHIDREDKGPWYVRTRRLEPSRQLTVGPYS